jgi:hypothetical protein
MFTYRDRCKSQIAKINSRTIIYLDTKFWLTIRKVHMNESDCREEIKLYNLIIKLSDENKAIFPLSKVALLEFLKQTDPISLKNTFDLVTKLSDNIAIRGYKERVFEEMLDYLYHCRSLSGFVRQPSSIKNSYVWTCVPYVWGKFIVSQSEDDSGEYDREVQEVLFKNKIVDSIFLEQMIENANRSLLYLDPSDLIKKRRINKRNSSKKWQADELCSELYCYKELIKPAIIEVFGKYEGSQIDQVFNVICNVRAKNKLDGFMSSIDVFSTLSATWLIGQNTNIEYNHYFDLHHAAAALPYCDMFFTEKSLHDEIVRVVPKLISGIKCKVYSNNKTVIAALKQC